MREINYNINHKNDWKKLMEYKCELEYKSNKKSNRSKDFTFVEGNRLTPKKLTLIKICVICLSQSIKNYLSSYLYLNLIEIL